jgi:hypothetical protein
MMDNLDDLDNLELIKWAFDFGYRLGNKDTLEGVHINSIEVEDYFILELNKTLRLGNNHTPAINNDIYY